MSAADNTQEIHLFKTFYYLKKITSVFDIHEDFTPKIIFEIITKTFRSERCKCSNIECIIKWLSLTIKHKDQNIIHCPSFNRNDIKCHNIEEEYNKCKHCNRMICSKCSVFPVDYDSDFSCLYEDGYNDDPICNDCSNFRESYYVKNL